jgi:diguanylate cyclase (GGDEF)-like protein
MEKNNIIEQKQRHIDQLIEIGLSLTSEKNFDRLMELILLGAKDLSNADGGTLYLVTENQKYLKFVVVQTNSLNTKMGGTCGKITWPELPLYKEDGKKNKEMVAVLCALEDKFINISDVYKAEKYNFKGTKKFDKQIGYRTKSMLVIPMKDHANKIIGVIQLLNKLDFDDNIIDFTKDDQKLISSMASQAAVTITNLRLEYQATHDFLTGLYNRQKFFDILSTEVKRTRRYKNPLSLIMFDIDFFKKINDNYGHDIGDEVLKLISETVQRLVREQDSVVRWGGEEFIILLPETNINGSETVAKKLNKTIKKIKEKDLPSITISLGVTTYRDTDDGNINKTLKRVDEALYIAKDTGRDKVVVL